MRIRETSPDDIKIVHDAANKTLKHHQSFNKFYDEVTNFDIPPIIETLALVAEDDENNILGVISGLLILKPKDRSFPFAQIQNIWVSEQERGKGIALLLHNAFIDVALKKGMKAVDIHIDIQNEIGLKFWNSLPYKAYQERRIMMLEQLDIA